MLLAYKTEIKPNSEQAIKINQTIGVRNSFSTK